MKEENKRCNGLVHGPPCTTWPPPWLASTPRQTVSVRPDTVESSPRPPLSPPDLQSRTPHGLPDDAELFIADANGYMNHEIRGEPYMWTWLHGPAWFYIADYPIPTKKGELMRGSREFIPDQNLTA